MKLKRKMKKSKVDFRSSFFQNGRGNIYIHKLNGSPTAKVRMRVQLRRKRRRSFSHLRSNNRNNLQGEVWFINDLTDCYTHLLVKVAVWVQM